MRSTDSAGKLWRTSRLSAKWTLPTAGGVKDWGGGAMGMAKLVPLRGCGTFPYGPYLTTFLRRAFSSHHLHAA